MIDLETVLTYLTLISVPIGVFYHIMTLNNTRKNQQMQLETRQAQLFMGVFNQLQSQELQNAYNFSRDIITSENIKEYYDPKHPDYATNRIHFTRLSLFFEGLGTLVREDLVPIRLVALMIQGLVRPWWEKARDFTYEQRANGYESAGSELEHLYLSMMKYIEENPDFYHN